jgi:mono/diheme cytochrome c family protein
MLLPKHLQIRSYCNPRPALACLLLTVTCITASTTTSASTSTSTSTTATTAPAKPIDFARDVKPIITQHCIKCHGPKKQKGKLRLDQRDALLRGGDSGEPAVLIGKSKESYLIKLVTEAVEDEVMPPKGKSLTDQQVATLRKWIDQGAMWPGQMKTGPAPAIDNKILDHWSFKPVTKPEVPKRTPSKQWTKKPNSSIDNFILARLHKAGLDPSPQADRRTLIRRASFIMLGLPPTPKQVQAFINDEATTSQAFERLVDRLLANKHYGERWARHWLDIARFAETNGFETNTPRPNAWRYRDYVIQAFNQDKPYDNFVKEQLAGDQLGAGVATSFIVGGPYDVVKSPDINLTLMQRNDELHDMINATSTAFLGLTVACARCHNHKFDPITQTDYYAFQAVFAGVKHGDRPIQTARTAETKKQIETLQKENNAHRAALKEFPPSPPHTTVHHTVIMDDESTGQVPGVEHLAEKKGMGANPPGAQRGRANDPGDVSRLPNISGGKYTYWEGKPNIDLIAYRPAVKGKFRVWASWGCGWHTHQTKTPYIFDLDGDPKTRNDQRLIATIDQQAFGDGTKDLVSKPLWSGFRDIGVHDFNEKSCIIIRAGATSNPVTADVMILQSESSIKKQSNPSSTQLATRPFRHPRLESAVNAKQNIETFSPTTAKYIKFNIFATNSAEPCIDEVEIYTTATASPNAKPRNVALRSAGAKTTSSGNYKGNPKHKLEHINDGQYGNSRSWISNTAGKGWVMFELKEAATIDRIVWARDRTEKYKDRLATNFRIEVANQINGKPGTWQTIASSVGRLPAGMDVETAPVYRFAGLSKTQAAKALQHHKSIETNKAKITALSKPATAYAGNFSQPGPTHRLFRGDPLAKREVVAPAAVLSLGGNLQLKADAKQTDRRAALANWIANKKNPLTARVMVNRIWMHHFGTGLVTTPSDFGHMGTKPSHPQLLDWLAAEFMQHGWSIKHIQKLILTSHTWQQQSFPQLEASKIDADSRLLWRFPPRRLAAEPIRDATLAVTGSLNTSTGGPGFNIFKPNSNYVRFYEPKETFGPAEWRRMIYMYKVRMEQDATFGVFDCPDAGQTIAKRARSTTALQALNLLNSSFMLQQSALLAKRLQDEAKDQPAQIKLAFSLAFSRSPEPDELHQSLQLINTHGLDAFCRALLNTNEFLFIQ